jgi:DNA-binding MarR family transcriptional regulator
LTQEGEDACYKGAQPQYIDEILSVLTTEQREQFKLILGKLKEKALKTPATKSIISSKQNPVP